jgi:hypothetical protein
MATTKINITIVSAVFACALLIGAINVMSIQAQNYDAGEEYKGFTFDHDEASESEAIEACDGDEECIECIEIRSDLSDSLKGYETVKCLKDPENSY